MKYSTMSGTSVEQVKASITEGHLRKVLSSDKGNNAQLISWTVCDFTKKGDNYSNIVTSVLVTYKVGNDSENTISYVAKILVNLGSEKLDENKRFRFNREARFLKEMVPELSSLLSSVGEAPLRIPKCYHISFESGNEIVFMEDLRARDFKMFDRKKGLDVAHTTLILQELARLHAASVMLRHSGREDTVDIAKDIASKEWTTYNETARDLTLDTLRGSIENAVTILKNVSGYERAIKWLLKLKPKVFEVMEDQIHQCDPFVVFCHGDSWTNNVLFRYSEGNIPVEVMLLDFELTRYASPAIDLNYLMLTSFNTSDRKDNIDNYLDIYHSAFRKAMEAGGLPIPFSYQQLQEEYKSKHLFGIITSLFVVPLVIAEDSAVTDIKVFLSGGSQEKQEAFMLDMVNKNPRFRSRYLNIFDEMMEKSVIP